MSNSETRIETLIKSVRNSPLGRQVIPMEAITGWPIVIRKKGVIFIKLLFFGVQQKEKGKTGLYPPAVMVAAELNSGKIVEYSDLISTSQWSDEEWAEPVGYFPHAAIAQMKVSEYKQLKKELMGMYDEMFETILNNDEFNQEWEAKFSHLLNTIIEPTLTKYYMAMGEKFFGHFLQ